MIAVLVTRPDGESDPLVTRAAQARLPRACGSDGSNRAGGFRRRAVGRVRLDRPDSARGVKALADLPAGPKFAAVGPETARALRARGIEPSHVPGRADGADLGDTLPDVDGKRIALVRASAAGEDLPERLRRRGAAVEEITAYRTVEGPAASAEKLPDRVGGSRPQGCRVRLGLRRAGISGIGRHLSRARHHDRAADYQQRSGARLRGHRGGGRPERVGAGRRGRPRCAIGGQKGCVSSFEPRPSRFR